MRLSGCPHSPNDNTCNLIHIITPPFIDIVVPYSVFYYLSPCSYSYQPLWFHQGAEFFSCSEAPLLCCFISGAWMKRAWGEKTMLSALTHLTPWHWGIRHRQGRENIISDIITLCKNLRETEAAVTHLVVSSTSYDYGIYARLAEVHLLQRNKVFMIAVWSCFYPFKLAIAVARGIIFWVWPLSVPFSWSLYLRNENFYKFGTNIHSLVLIRMWWSEVNVY